MSAGTSTAVNVLLGMLLVFIVVVCAISTFGCGWGESLGEEAERECRGHDGVHSVEGTPSSNIIVCGDGTVP